MPLARYGTPQEIDGALVFLESDLASFFTGQALIVAGGTYSAFPHLAEPGKDGRQRQDCP
jgi:NAD(P)-dependent dehydrogenase (short-subunit alcohol dehydrogenase family)